MSDKPIAISVVIPCKDESKRLPRTLATVAEYLSAQDYVSEIIIVDDGSRDTTAAIVNKMANEHVRLLQHKGNLGKGAAIRTGMMAAQGTEVLFMDADLSVPISELALFRSRLAAGADIVIGSRALNRSLITVKQPFYRRVIGNFGNLLVRGILGLPFLDTQCGFKLFRKDVGQALFTDLRLTGWSFDYEILYEAERRGYRVKEVAVPWSHSDESKFHPVRDAVRCFFDLLWLRWNRKRVRPLFSK